MIVTCWMQTVYEKSCLSLTTSSIMKTLLLVCTLPKKYSLPFVKGTLEIHPPGRNFPQWIFSAGVLTQNIQVPIIPVVSSLLISPRFDCAVNVPSLHSCFRCEIEIFSLFLLSFPQNDRKIYKLRQLSLSQFVYFSLVCQKGLLGLPQVCDKIITGVFFSKYLLLLPFYFWPTVVQYYSSIGSFWAFFFILQ